MRVLYQARMEIKISKGDQVINEAFPAHEFEIREDVESAIREGYIRSEVVGWRCPRCNAETKKPLSHNTTVVCKCGLKVRKSANSLLCWAEGVASA